MILKNVNLDVLKHYLSLMKSYGKDIFVLETIIKSTFDVIQQNNCLAPFLRLLKIKRIPYIETIKKTINTRIIEVIDEKVMTFTKNPKLNNNLINELKHAFYWLAAENIDIANLGLTSICNRLPIHLRYLKCRNNKLIELPDLPYNLYYLDCSKNKLTSIPPLPNGLKQLHCNNNNLTALPSLPSSLTDLNCSNNPNLTALPNIPAQGGRLTIICRNTGIKDFSNIPSRVRIIYK